MLRFIKGRDTAASDAVPEGGGEAPVPHHLAIIMDGNGRWAQKRGLPRIAGHKRGLDSVRKVTREAKALGIRYLTLFAFSTENWLRPKEEVHGLMDLFRLYMRRECAELVREGVRIRFIGDAAGMPKDIQALMAEAETLTAGGEAMTLVVALNYGSRAEIVRATRRLADRVAAGEIPSDGIDEDAIAAELTTDGIPDPDLIIRTSGEQRLSNFLLWQAAYAEFIFTEQHWPDFGADALRDAISVFKGRDRRFGGVRQGR